MRGRLSCARMRDHHSQRQRHPLGRAQGLFRWLADAERGRRLPAGDSRRSERRSSTRHDVYRPQGYHVPSISTRRRRATAASRIYSQAQADSVTSASASRSSTTRAATSRRTSARSRWSRCTCRPARPAGAPGVQVSLPRGVPAAPARAQAKRPRVHPVRRLEHRAPADRPAELARQPEELRLPAGRARVARRSCSTSSASSTCSARSNREPEQYTWWSNRGQAWAKNVGWRIDYQIATPGIAATARARGDLQEPPLLRPCAADHGL